MENITPELLRKKFATDAGRAAFDELNALGPNWAYESTAATGRVSLSATIEVRRKLNKPDSKVLSFAKGAEGRTVDDIALKMLQSLKQFASALKASAIVDVSPEERRIFSFDGGTNRFSEIPGPFKPPAAKSKGYLKAIFGEAPNRNEATGLPDGGMEWRVNGELDSYGGAAVTEADGTKKWYRKGLLHNDYGPAIVTPEGEKFWYHEGKLHRKDGPAIEHADGGRAWYTDGKLSRIFGPAVERADGSNEWWISGRRLAQSEVDSLMESRLEDFLLLDGFRQGAEKLSVADRKLFRALLSSDKTLVREALRQGADVKAMDGAPLVIAGQRQDRDMAVILLAAGADISQSIESAWHRKRPYSKKSPDTVWIPDWTEYRHYGEAPNWLQEHKGTLLEKVVREYYGALVEKNAALEKKAAELQETIINAARVRDLDKPRLQAPTAGPSVG